MPYWISGEHAYTVNAVHINTFCNLWFTQMKHVSAVGAHVVRVFTAFLVFPPPRQFGLNALKLLPLWHIKVWSTARVCLNVPVRDPPRTKRCEWLTRTCRIHLIPTLHSRVHTGHCQPSTGKSVQTPTNIHACCTRALLSASHATKTVSNTLVYKLHPLYTLFVHRTEHALYTQNRTWLSHTEQNIPSTHRTEHAFCSQTEKSILLTQNKAYCSHTEQGMLFTRKAEHVVRTLNRESCSHTEQCMLFAHNRACCSHTTVCCSHTEQSKLHTTGRAVHTQQGVLFHTDRAFCSHTEQSTLFTYKTEHYVHRKHSMQFTNMPQQPAIHTQNRACCYAEQSMVFTHRTEHSVHTQNRAFCSQAK